jgi:hypothetical protein
MEEHMKKWTAICAFTALATLACGPGEKAGVGDLERDEVEVEIDEAGFGISGVVDGLDGELTLEVSGLRDSRLVIESDGGFTLPAKLADGAAFSVEIVAQPPGQRCDTRNGDGRVAGADITDVEIVCLSDNATLADLQVSVGALAPSFSPEGQIFAVNVGLFTGSISLRAVADDDGAVVTIDGVPVTSGDASEPRAIAVGVNIIPVVVTSPSGVTRTYSVLVERSAEVLQEAYAKASNTDTDDHFGFAVALDGDTLAVSAPREDGLDNSAILSGAVYVFRREGDAWSQEAFLKASNADAGDFFGSELALSGDTLVISAPNEDSDAVDGPGDNTASNAGAVYVFTREGEGWSQSAQLKASNAEAGDLFGAELALSGDTLAVSAIGEAGSGVNDDESDNSDPNSGAVYVFTRSAGEWTQDAYLKASNTGAGDLFGGAVALDGDTLVVGAPGEDSAAVGVGGSQVNNSAESSGAAYVFTRADGFWTQTAYLKASNADLGDRFGFSVALASGVVAVGAIGEASAALDIDGFEADNSVPASGAVYIFGESGGVWSQEAYVKASNRGSGEFGGAISLSGESLAVGAARESSGATGIDGDQADTSADSAGAVYVFTRTDSVWAQVAYVKASNTEAFDTFGSALALSGDTLAVGASREDSAATGVDGDDSNNDRAASGAAYVSR